MCTWGLQFPNKVKALKASTVKVKARGLLLKLKRIWITDTISGQLQAKDRLYKT